MDELELPFQLYSEWQPRSLCAGQASYQHPGKMDEWVQCMVDCGPQKETVQHGHRIGLHRMFFQNTCRNTDTNCQVYYCQTFRNVPSLSTLNENNTNLLSLLIHFLTCLYWNSLGLTRWDSKAFWQIRLTGHQSNSRTPL